MNVSQLREAIARLPDHAEVVVLVDVPASGGGCDEECVGVGGVELANFGGTMCLLITEQ